MKFIISSLFLLTASLSFAGTNLKLEGTCNGSFKNGTPVSFTYHSNFNGCKNTSTGAIAFTDGSGKVLTGVRTLGSKDVYSFKIKEGKKTREHVRLTFANSTGNTEGSIRYLNENNKIQTATVSCEIRDYEYGDC